MPYKINTPKMPKHITKITLLSVLLCFLLVTKTSLVKAQQQILQQQKKIVPNNMPNRLFGLTIDESSLDEQLMKMQAPKLIEHILTELRIIKASQINNNTLTVRIVIPVGCESGGNCDSSEVKATNKLDKKYLDLMQRIKSEGLAFVMAEVVDSDVGSSGKCFKGLDEAKSVTTYLERTKKLYEKLGKYVDIWEIGNEVNGDWVGGNFIGTIKNNQRRKIVVAQIKAAYDFLTAKKQEITDSNTLLSKQEKIPLTAITFYFSGVDKKRHSYENINDAMMGWIRGEGAHFVDSNKNKITFTNLDYLLVSYYPEDNFYEEEGSNKPKQIVLTPKEWVEIFATIKANYSNTTKFGLGEVGAQCYFSKKADKCNTLLLDYEMGQRNPCDKYDAKGNLIETRKCPCCLTAQVQVMKAYYIDLDKQICEAMENDSRFKNAEQFTGGYFNWYYSNDVVNKIANGNAVDKIQAEKVRAAIIEAYKDFNK
jgi:hypothetical protein